MKNFFTTLIISISFLSFSQITQDNQGYFFNWKQNQNTVNCDISSITSNNYLSLDSINGYLTYNQQALKHTYSVNLFFKDINCKSAIVDLSSDRKIQTITVKVKADKDVNSFGIGALYHTTGWTNTHNHISLKKDEWTIKTFQMPIIAGSSINGPGGHFPFDSMSGVFIDVQGNDTAKFEIDWISIGNAKVPNEALTNVFETKKTKESILNIFPNPASNFVTIKSKKNDLNISLFNTLGIEINSFKMTNKEQILNVSELQSGIYFIQFKDDNGIMNTERLIIK